MTEFEHPRLDEELHQHRSSPMAVGVNPTDGMPQQLMHAVVMPAPPLTRESLICMADTRRFVVRDLYGNILCEIAPEHVTRTPRGGYQAPEGAVEAALAHIVANDHLLCLRIAGTGMVRVQPVREACEHYVRQRVNIADVPGHFMINRFCLAQRTDNGEHVSLRDAEVRACDMRLPRDLVSEKQLDDFDEAELAKAEAKQDEAEFDPSAELERINPVGDAPEGIFKP